MKHLYSVLLVALLAACAPPYPDESDVEARAAQPGETRAQTTPMPVADDASAAIEARLATLMPGVEVDAIRPTPLPGLYEIQAGMEFAYVSGDGRYLLNGDLADLQTRRQLTEERRKGARLEAISDLPGDSFIEFGPEDAPYTVTVFTDIDCGYCRMLHQHIEEYGEQGIRVRYAFFPRSGANTESFFKAEQVWCSGDRRQALTDAKAGEPLDAPKDCDNPIAEQLQMAGVLGLRGTPAIILPDGTVVPGYQPPEQLRGVLDEIAHQAPVAPARSG